MTKTKLTKIIKMAKESTEEVWGFIKREEGTDEYPPAGQPSVEGDEWKEKTETKKIIIDNVAWRTYESVLSILIRSPHGEQVLEAQQQMIKLVGELIELLQKEKENNTDNSQDM